jgi:hypothetical protein
VPWSSNLSVCILLACVLSECENVLPFGRFTNLCERLGVFHSDIEEEDCRNLDGVVSVVEEGMG